MVSTREQIITAMCDLMELHGYHGAGLNQVVKESGAPKGSLYHYFPDGKDELAAEAIERAGRLVAGRIEQSLASEENVALSVRRFVEYIAGQVEASGFASGGPLTAVAMETATGNERLNLACRAAFARIEEAFAAALVRAGLPEPRAQELGIFITASIEGGTLLSRTAHSGGPLRQVARELARLLSHEQAEVGYHAPSRGDKA
jgi:TetR/AcrR family transcriptional regulator, lmrAB and yxaGH operons repressor